MMSPIVIIQKKKESCQFSLISYRNDKTKTREGSHLYLLMHKIQFIYKPRRHRQWGGFWESKGLRLSNYFVCFGSVRSLSYFTNTTHLDGVWKMTKLRPCRCNWERTSLVRQALKKFCIVIDQLSDAYQPMNDCRSSACPRDQVGS